MAAVKVSTYHICVPLVRDGWLSSLHHHDSLHILEAGVRGHKAVERQLIVESNAYIIIVKR